MLYYHFFINDLKNGLWIFLFIILIQFAIVLFLMIDYLLNTTKGDFIITDEYILNDVNDIEIVKEEIKEVIVFGAPSISRKSSFKLLPFEGFHYVKIICKNNVIIMSSLLDFNLYEKISKERIFKNKIKFNKKGLTGRGSWINSIYLNELD